MLSRYAFTPLLDRDEDYSSEEEDDILYSDAWEGLKMRGTGKGYRPDSPDGNLIQLHKRKRTIKHFIL